MKTLLLKFCVRVLRVLNLCFKPFKQKNQVVIMSRQSDKPTLDIMLLKKKFDEMGVHTIVLTKAMGDGISGKISYGFHLFTQMKYLATSKVVVLDGYCMLASVLPKKKDQCIVQLWHALGAIKKFGWQSVNNPDGRTIEVAETLCMHRNYDYIVAPGKINGAFFAEAFRTPQDKVVYYGLPRIDFLKSKSNEQLFVEYPQIREKNIILYAPTFRKNAELELERLVDSFDFEKHALVIKKHFLDKGDYAWAKEKGAIVDGRFSSMDWLKICDGIITDYSAIIFEAAILGKDIYIYQPDRASYEHNVGLNVDIGKEAIGKYVCESEKELVERMDGKYDKAAVIAFCDKYIEIDTDHCTEDFCRFVIGKLEK
ncbi:MAG: CDP-glycerol glycerophosphotransferase family protein [Lachnospiraceae bacterium]|nr:CDP-glycerol glycerophosphotransferase family protein [Lachnospiraceae bacterium]